MFGRINIVYDMHKDAMQIPRSAIVEEAGQSAIYVVEDNLAERRIIRTGYADGGQVEVLDGLGETEVFVIVGQTSLKDGSKVSIINAADAGEKPADAGMTST